MLYKYPKGKPPVGKEWHHVLADGPDWHGIRFILADKYPEHSPTRNYCLLADYCNNDEYDFKPQHVNELLAKVDVNRFFTYTTYKTTLLNEAIKHANQEMIRVLIKAGANLDTDACVAKQKELDIQLLQEGIKTKVNYKKVETLLKKGANPMGLVNDDGTEAEIVYSEILFEHNLDEPKNDTIIKLTDMFLRHGMVVKCIDYDREMAGHISNPFWEIGYYHPDKATTLLFMIINANLDFQAFEQLIDHLHTDSSMIGSELEEVDGYLRILLYLSSYKYLLKKSKYFRDVINYENNKRRFNTENFRKLSNYRIEFDTTNQNNYNNQGIVATIVNIKTNKKVWKIVL